VIPSGQPVRLLVPADWRRLFQRRPGRAVGKLLSEAEEPGTAWVTRRPKVLSDGVFQPEA